MRDAGCEVRVAGCGVRVPRCEVRGKLFGLHI
jgi:hypothetical protein